MSDSSRSAEAGACVGSELAARVEVLARQIGRREAEHAEALERARAQAESLRAQVARALERFHRAAAEAGAPHLRIELSPVRVDDKHLRAFEFELGRGRHRAIVVAKSRGEVTLVGPFRSGQAEGPCKSFPSHAGDEIHGALGAFLERLLEEAATP